MPSTPRRVLVTGSAGAIGQPVCRELLARGHHVRGLDMRETPGVPDQSVADIADHRAVLSAAEGCDTILHLAAYPNEGDFLSVLLRPNVIGLFNVCDAARALKVRRLILTSSIQAVGRASKGVNGGTLRADQRPEPVNHYGLTKVWMEEMGAMYARAHELSVLAVRVVWLPRTERDVARLDRGGAHDSYLSPGDAGRFYACAVESQRPRPGEFAILLAASKPRGNPPPYDLEAARQLIGYEPRDTWPMGVPGTN